MRSVREAAALRCFGVRVNGQRSPGAYVLLTTGSQPMRGPPLPAGASGWRCRRPWAEACGKIAAAAAAAPIHLRAWRRSMAPELSAGMFSMFVSIRGYPCASLR